MPAVAAEPARWPSACAGLGPERQGVDVHRGDQQDHRGRGPGPRMGQRTVQNAQRFGGAGAAAGQADELFAVAAARPAPVRWPVRTPPVAPWSTSAVGQHDFRGGLGGFYGGFARIGEQRSKLRRRARGAPADSLHRRARGAGGEYLAALAAGAPGRSTSTRTRPIVRARPPLKTQISHSFAPANTSALASRPLALNACRCRAASPSASVVSTSALMPAAAKLPTYLATRSLRTAWASTVHWPSPAPTAAAPVAPGDLIERDGQIGFEAVGHELPQLGIAHLRQWPAAAITSTAGTAATSREPLSGGCAEPFWPACKRSSDAAGNGTASRLCTSIRPRDAPAPLGAVRRPRRECR